MILAFCDTETTGLSVEKGDKIVEICFRLYDLDTQKLTGSFVQRIDPQRSIAADAQRVHGISSSDLIGKPVFKDVAQGIIDILNDSDLFIAHNLAFDAEFIISEIVAAGFDMPKINGFDTMAARWATPLGKNPNLGELCFALGVDYDPSKAHSAEYDVDVTAKCFFAGLDRGFYVLPE
tara:strand:- start:78630 stop:79163 length:534 start_codon:yes stop_codon:yes gene_type:complete